MKVRVLAASVFLAGLVLLALLEPASGLLTSAQAWPVIGATPYGAQSDPNFGGEPSCEREGGNVEVVGWIGGYARALALQGKYAYVGAGARLKVVDVSNPARPAAVGQSAFLPDLVEGVAVADRYAYLADGEGGLRVVDVSNPISPTLAGFLDMPEDARGIALAGDYAYVADGEGGLRIVNIASPVTPTLASFLDTPGEAHGVVVSGTYAFVADGASGLRILDVSNPMSPTLVGSYNTPGNARGVAVAGKYAYVADEESGLRIVDVSNPVSPVLASFYDVPGEAQSVAVSGTYAYVADEERGLCIVDVANPVSPTLAGSHNTPGDAHAVAIAGNLAFVASGEGGLWILRFKGPGPGPTPTPTPSAVPPTTTVVYVDPPVASTTLSVPVTVAVAISNVVDLGSFQFTLAYSPTLATVEDVILGPFPGSSGRTVTSIGPAISPTLGTVTFGAYSQGATPAGPGGFGPLAYVRLSPASVGVAPLHLSNVQVATVPGTTVPVVTRDGLLAVTDCPGDFDGDGDVDIVDVQRIAYRWNTTRGDALYDPLYDLDDDGDIDIVDVQRSTYRWGTRCILAAGDRPMQPRSQNPASLSFAPNSKSVAAGQVFTVGVAIDNVVDLGAFEFTLGYDPAVVEIIGATTGSFPGESKRTVLLAGPAVSPVAGRFDFGAYSLGAEPAAPSGTGNVAVLTLKALRTGDTTLSFDRVQVSDHVGNVQSVVSQQDGRVVVGTDGPWHIFLPALIQDW